MKSVEKRGSGNPARHGVQAARRRQIVLKSMHGECMPQEKMCFFFKFCTKAKISMIQNYLPCSW